MERAVLRLADGMSDTPVRVTDEMIDALRPDLDEEQIVEVAAHLAWEQFRARFNRSLDLPSDNLSDGGFCPMPVG